ncbi:MAG: glycosyltransferase family 25 protein [Parachlamydiales bacterium]|nr:glycosyltransferase family 25 protein [Parachlamydiales bacterium]
MRILFLLFIHSIVFAELADHFKPAPNKSAAYSMQGIDFIYLINLDERPEKLRTSLDQLSPFQIYPYRFSAVNGWKLTLEEINDIGVIYSPEMEGGFMGTSYHTFEPSHEVIQNFGQTYFSHCFAKGPMGCTLSHLSVLQDAWDSGYETIWVMEDDIEVIQDPRILPNIIKRLDDQVGKGNWDILFTDRDMRDMAGNYTTTYWAGRRPDYMSNNDFAMKKRISEDFFQIGARSGTHSMVIRRSGMKKLLQFFKAHQIFLPYDMEIILPRGIKLYTVAEDIISNQPKAASDNGAPNYLNREKS